MSLVPTDLLLETFQYLELNEIEKCQYVNFQWNHAILSDRKKTLKQKRRIHVLKVAVEISTGRCFTSYSVVGFIRFYGLNGEKKKEYIPEDCPKMWELLGNCFIHKIEFPRYMNTNTLSNTVVPYLSAIMGKIEKKLDANFLFGQTEVVDMLKNISVNAFHESGWISETFIKNHKYYHNEKKIDDVKFWLHQEGQRSMYEYVQRERFRPLMNWKFYRDLDILKKKKPNWEKLEFYY